MKTNLLKFVCCISVLSLFAVNAHALSAGAELTCDTGDLSSDTSAVFQANWEPIEWNVTYNINGASGTLPSDYTCQYTGTCDAAVQGDLLKTNSIFGGWAMTCSVTGGSCADFTPRTVSAGESIDDVTTSDGATITLTAVWNECTPCNPSHATCSLSVVNNTCVYTTACLTGYENIQNNGQYNPSCTAKTVALTFVDEDGVTPVEPESDTCTYDEQFNLPDAPTKQGFRFLGWTLVQ